MTIIAEPKVHITITIPQARAMVAALDIYMRLGLGQVQVVSEMVADETIPIKAGSRLPWVTPKGEMEDAVHHVTAWCHEIRRALGFLPGESYGVGNRAVSDEAHRAYEMEKVIQKVLALHDDPTPTFRGVHYDGLTVRYTGDPMPECVIEKGAAS